MSIEMKVTTTKSTGFYIRAAKSFFSGTDANAAADGQPAVEAKAPVEELKISGFGKAINVVSQVAVKLEADSIADISNITTGYPEINSGRRCPQIVISMKKLTKTKKNPETRFTVTVVNLNGEAILHEVEIGVDEQLRILMFRAADVLGEHHRVQLIATDGRKLAAATAMKDSGLNNGDTLTAVTSPAAVLEDDGGGTAELKADGIVVVTAGGFASEGFSKVQHQLTDVGSIYCTRGAFAALNVDGIVVSWGREGEDGDSSQVQAQLSVDVGDIYPTNAAFAALKIDGAVVAWGDK